MNTLLIVMIVALALSTTLSIFFAVRQNGPTPLDKRRTRKFAVLVAILGALAIFAGVGYLLT